MKSKGFLMLESIIAISIAFIGVSIFSVIFIDGHHLEQRIEQETDQALAQHLIGRFELSEITIHDHVYRGKS